MTRYRFRQASRILDNQPNVLTCRRILEDSCRLPLVGAGDDYDLKHLWLHDEKNDGKIAAYFPGRTRKKRQVKESHSDMYTADGATVEEYVEKEEWEDPDPEKYADHFQATLHDMQVEKEQIQEGDHTTYILRAHYPSSTCYQQTGYHCWAFAIPIPTPAETEQKRVRVNPC
nr:hypothetical protein BaRGS_033154 [Batillaria attramentaria]